MKNVGEGENQFFGAERCQDNITICPVWMGGRRKGDFFTPGFFFPVLLCSCVSPGESLEGVVLIYRNQHGDLRISNSA